MRLRTPFLAALWRLRMILHSMISDCCVLRRIRLREVFTQSFGRVAHVNLKENKVRRGPSYAFIIFESSDSAQKAIAQGSMLVDGRSLKFEARR